MSKATLRTEILKAAFKRAQAQNKSYSLRSLAQKLKLSPAFVSKVFNGKADLPLARAADMVKALKMDKASEGRLLESYIDERLKKVASGRPKSKKSDPFSKYEEFGDKDFILLTEWFYVPILDSLSLKNITPDVGVIARRFGISRKEAEKALDFLIQNQYLRQDANGRWKKHRQHFRFPTERSRELIRSYHSKMMGRAIHCLKTQTDASHFEKRLINGMSIATNSKNIDLAVKRLNEALYEIGEILSQGECDEVYHLNIQLFPLTQPD